MCAVLGYFTIIYDSSCKIIDLLKLTWDVIKKKAITRLRISDLPPR